MSIPKSVKTASDADAWVDGHVAMSKRNGVISVVGDLSPLIADALLRRNPSNRTMTATKLAQYELDMMMGAWSLNGEPIIIADTGEMNDGQHRCVACVKSQRQVKTLFVFGVPRETRTTVDQGALRTNGQRLQMTGVKNANNCAAIAGMLWQYQQFGLVTKQCHRRPTAAAVEETFAANASNIAASLAVADKTGVNMVGKASLIAFCHLVFAKADSEKAEAFVSQLISGANLDEKSPIFAVRNRLISGGGRMKIEEKTEAIFRAWNHYVDGGSLGRIQLGKKKKPDEKHLPMRKLPSVKG